LDIQRNWLDVHFVYKQSNHEGDLIDWIQEANDENGDAALNGGLKNGVKGIVLNAGGYSHTSVALRDAVEESEVPVVEVHISDTHAREPFRNIDFLADVCAHTIIGHGTDGYKEAVEHILSLAGC
jgi:3-dehydroquinate dehydratase-2